MQNDNAKIKNSKKGESLEKQNNKKNKDIEEIAHLKQKVEKLENQVKHVFADYQNLERRVAIEKKEWLVKANKELILKLLPALDFLLLSVKHIDDEGLRLSIQNFFDILKTEGVERVETSGKPFDPLTMECIGTKVGEEGKVLEEIRLGYRLNDMVLRPAQVIVGFAEQNRKEKN